VGVADAVVLLDREQGGRGNLQRAGVELTSVLTMTQLLEHLQHAGKITMETTTLVMKFLSENATIAVPKSAISGNSTHQPQSPSHLSYTERAHLSSNALAKRLLLLMEQKSTNLALSADVSTSAQLLEVSGN
jgi:uridine monophosphate synthetase